MYGDLFPNGSWPYNVFLTFAADPSRRVVAIILCKIQTVRKIQNPKSKIQNPRSKIQNPKSKIQNPKSKIQNPRSKIQNPKSKIQTAAFGAATKRTDTTTIQNPKSKIQDPRSKIQNPKSKIQNPKSKVQNPRSKIQNPKSKIQNPKSKIQNPRSKIQNPKSKVQNPNSKIQNPNGPFGFWILEFGFGWPGWGGYVGNALVWMGWPPKFGVVGRDPSLQAKGRRLDSPRARLKLGPDFQMVISCVVETGGQFPENLWRVVVCQATILWAQLRERGQEKKGSKIGCRSLLLPCSLITGWNCGCSGFLGSFYGKDGEQKKMWKTSAVGNNFWCRCNHMCGYTHRSFAGTPLAAMHGVRVGGWQALAY